MHGHVESKPNIIGHPFGSGVPMIRVSQSGDDFRISKKWYVKVWVIVATVGSKNKLSTHLGGVGGNYLFLYRRDY